MPMLSAASLRRISIWNNGKGIPIQMHQKEKVYVPELIFGHLLTSSNYDDNEKKVCTSLVVTIGIRCDTSHTRG